MKVRKGLFVAAAIAVGLFCGACSQSSPSPAGPSAPAAGTAHQPSAPQPVPFRGNLEGTQTRTPLQPPFASVNGSGSGNATHLGQYSAVFPHIVNLATRIGQGTYTFTAADGSTVTANFTGQAQGGPAVVSIEETATITGGTGRFANATGSFVVQRTFEPATGRTEGSFDGTITVADGGKQ